MKRYTVYNTTTGMVQYVTEPLTEDEYAETLAKELNNGCSLTDALCTLSCRHDRQRFNAETGVFENTSTEAEQVEYEQLKNGSDE